MCILHRINDLDCMYSSRQTSWELVIAGRAAKRGTCCVRINIHSRKHNLLHYLHASSCAWYQDLTSGVAVIMEGEARHGRYNRDIHSKD
jgi:hypothetical protein